MAPHLKPPSNNSNKKMSITTATISAAPAATKAIFSPIKVGNNNLKHRVVLAP